jgi:hypothetical protein
VGFFTGGVGDRRMARRANLLPHLSATAGGTGRTVRLGGRRALGVIDLPQQAAQRSAYALQNAG